MREKYGGESVLVGFSTYTGTAARDWDVPAGRTRVRPALKDSYEALFHEVGVPRFLISLRGGSRPAKGLGEPRLERAIGVIYRPETERQSHYFHARLPAQFDAVLHSDETTAVEPPERTAGWEAGDGAGDVPLRHLKGV